MKPEEINRAVAECMGWKRGTIQESSFRDSANNIEVARWIRPDGIAFRKVPDYFADLNACREMISSLDDGERGWFATHLYHAVIPQEIQHNDSFIDWWTAEKLANAAAPQRCEAFLKLKGKWIQ